MEKTITLNETQMKLLQEYRQAEAAFVVARDKVRDTAAEEPCFDDLVIDLSKAGDARDFAANVFAMSF